MKLDLLQQLSPEQQQAVTYIDGPELVIAGAGSGKTRVLTYKIAYLIEMGIAPRRIMALTFTNKAAREMKERIAALVDPYAASCLWMGTFHSILLRILRLHADRLGFRYDFTIYDTADSRSLVKLIVSELGLDEKQYKPATVAAIISNAKNALISPQRYASDRQNVDLDAKNGRPMVAQIYRMYQERCKIAMAMDFDDILYYANVLLRDNEDLKEYYGDLFDYVLVDEYQDTNFAQSLIVNNLVYKKRKLCVVGDDAQSIYAFRGANVANILTMRDRFPDLRLYKLERNYRSTQNIVEAAGSLIKHNKAQIPKNVYSKNEEGEKIEIVEAFSDIEEASFVAAAISRRQRISGSSFEDMAVLYRTNAQSRTIEEALRRRAVPYRIFGGVTFYQRKEVKDALAYFRLAVNPDDDEALRRVINFPARGIGDTTMKKVKARAIEKGLSMWEVISSPLQAGLDINKGTQAKLNNFVELIGNFHESVSRINAYDLGRDIFNGAGLISMYASSSTPEEVSKHENLNEMLAGLKEFVDRHEQDENVSMGAFLSEVSLLTDQDDSEEEDDAKLTLMTVHAAKGLEFDHVFITGLEENLFPGAKALDSPEQLEEERRLLYVALTRARKTVMLSYANRRFKNGTTADTLPSRFLLDINPRYLNGIVRRNRTSYNEYEPYSDHAAYAKSKDQKFSLPAKTRISKPNVSHNHSSSSVLTSKFVKVSAHKNTTSPSIKTQNPDAPYQKGQKIRHSKFGIGIVADYISDPEPMLVVDFIDFGTKKLMLRFAKITLE